MSALWYNVQQVFIVFTPRQYLMFNINCQGRNQREPGRGGATCCDLSQILPIHLLSEHMCIERELSHD